jgi:hypothetical protein
MAGLGGGQDVPIVAAGEPEPGAHFLCQAMIWLLPDSSPRLQAACRVASGVSRLTESYSTQPTRAASQPAMASSSRCWKMVSCRSSIAVIRRSQAWPSTSSCKSCGNSRCGERARLAATSKVAVLDELLGTQRELTFKIRSQIAPRIGHRASEVVRRDPEAGR